MIKQATFFSLLCLTLFCISCGQQTGVKTIKLAHSLNVNHSVHIAMEKMGQDLAEISGGKMRLEIFPSQQLGTERECLELLQIGSLDMTKVSSGVLENFAPKMKVFGIPFLFRDKEHLYQVLDGPIGQEILDDGIQYWLKGVAYYDAGSRSFYSKNKPIYEPKDLAGLKVRVMESVTAMNMVKSLGGSPTPISWGELYTSLQQGVVDGAENNPPSFYLSKHYEVCKYYTLDEHTSVPDVLIMSTHFWNKLSEQEKEWVKTSVKNSIPYQRTLWQESEEEALQAVADYGVEIIRPDKEKFRALVSDLYDSYKSDTSLYHLITDIQAAQ